MTQNGAKHIVILAPSGATKDTVQSLVTDLASIGTALRPIPCDVANAEQLESTFRVCQHALPPIQGVIFAAVSIKVRTSVPFRSHLVSRS